MARNAAIARDRFADLTERILYLRALPFATTVSPTLLRVLAAATRETTFPKGALLARKGQPVDALQLVTSGRVELVSSGAPRGVILPRQNLGHLTILGRTDAPWDAIATEITSCLEIPADALMDMMEDHTELLRATVRWLCEQILVTIKQLPEQALGSRLAGEPFEVPDRELDLVERMVFLRRLSGFAAANLNSIAMLARQVTEVRAEAGQRFWSAGDPAETNLFVVRGTARCSAPDGRVWSAAAGSALGGIEGVAREPRWYTLEADGPFVGFWLGVSGFEQVLDDDFGLAETFIANVASQVEDVMARQAALGRSAPEAKPSGR